MKEINAENWIIWRNWIPIVLVGIPVAMIYEGHLDLKGGVWIPNLLFLWFLVGGFWNGLNVTRSVIFECWKGKEYRVMTDPALRIYGIGLMMGIVLFLFWSVICIGMSYELIRRFCNA